MTQKPSISRHVFFKEAVLLLLALIVMLQPVWSYAGEAGKAQGGVPENKYQALEEKWGVRPASIRLTASDYFLDFRYLITDPEKAKTVLARSKENKEIYLLVQKTGAKFPVPVTKVGALRSSALNPKKGRQYTVLFSNVGKSIKKGDKVSVVIGKFKAENLTVE